jgi:hypothetical protein
MTFAVTSPLLLTSTHFNMQTSNGPRAELNSFSGHTKKDVRNTSKKVKVSLTPTQAEFIDFVLFHGVNDLSKSLKLVHDLALYHSDVIVDKNEKSALFDVKLLWEGFDRIGEEC